MSSSNSAQFATWLRKAQPGETYVYFTGSEFRHTATVMAARDAYDRGEVDLVQKRTPIARLGFHYMAIKRRVVRAPVWLLADSVEDISRV
jgi:hypothetical protein